MDGKERLTLLHNIFHMDTREQLQFDWSWLLPSGLNTKDFIAPSSFDFTSTRSFTMGGQYCAVSALNIMASRMDDELITKLMALNNNLIVSIQIQPMEQAAALKMIRRTMTNVDAMKISEQKRLCAAGMIWTFSRAALPPTAKKRKRCWTHCKIRMSGYFSLRCCC